MPEPMTAAAGAPPMEMTVPAGVLWCEVAPGLALPQRFAYSEESRDGMPRATLHMRVDPDKGVTCERLVIEPRSADEPITARVLRRINFGSLMQRAPVRAAQPITFDYYDETGRPPLHRDQHIRVVRRLQPDGTRMNADSDAWLIEDPSTKPVRGGLADRWEDMPSDELISEVLKREGRTLQTKALTDEDRAAVQTATTPGRQRRHLLTDEELREVVQTYKLARDLGQRDPTEQVRKKHHASRTTASRWIRRARDLGWLEPPGS